MNDLLISQLTGIPLKQIQSYNPQQKQQVIAMAKKSPKWDTFQDNVNKASMEVSSKSMENLGYTPGLQGWTKTYNTNLEEFEPKTKPKLVRQPSWEYMGKGALGEGQSWRKVAGNMRVNGRQVDNSNKPVHSSASSYPESKQEKQAPKLDKRQEKPSEVPTSVVATINRTAARFPGGGGGYSANGNRNGKAFFGLADSDALVNLAGDAWNATKGFMSKVGDYLSGPDKPIQTNTPSYGRRNLITEGMQKVHNTFGNAYH